MANFTVYPPRKNTVQGENYYTAYYLQNKEFFSLMGVDFSCFTIVKGAEKYLIYGLTKLKKPSFAVKKEGGNEMIANDLPILFMVRHTAGKGRNGDTEEPKPVDKKISEIIEQKELYNNGSQKLWAGKLFYDEDETCLETVGFENLKPLETGDLPPIPDDAANRAASGGGKPAYGKPSQNEKEKMTERIEVLLSQLPSQFKTLAECFAYLEKADLDDSEKSVIKNVLEYF